MTHKRAPGNADDAAKAPQITRIGDSWLLAASPTQQEQLSALWAMTVPERVSAMRAGTLSRDQLFAWVGRYPE